MDITSLIPGFGGVLWTLLAFVVALSIIVAIHEYGHYIVGRWTGIKADVFSLGFGPVLWSRHDKHGTRWQLAALPFGGYVKFRGDSNASGGMDAEAMAQMSQEELRHTMNGAPLWARALTVLAGPVFNFALSIVLFTGLFMLGGTVKEPLTVGKLQPMPFSQDLREGDQIVKIEGLAPPLFDASAASFEAFKDALPVQGVLAYTVERDGQQQVVDGPYVYPPIVTQVVPRSAANEAGIEPGDVILSIDGQPIYAFDQLKERVEGSEGATLALEVWREGETLAMDMTPKHTDEPLPEGGFQRVYRIGIVGGLPFEPATSLLGPWDAFTSGVARTGDIMVGSLSGLWNMVVGNISSCNLSGPIGIAETSGAMAAQGGESFITFIAVLSTAVGLLNLFPVPVLDGGHLVFHAWEAVSGKPPSDRALNALMSVGLVLILGLMVFALTNDIFCP